MIRILNIIIILFSKVDKFCHLSNLIKLYSKKAFFRELPPGGNRNRKSSNGRINFFLENPSFAEIQLKSNCPSPTIVSCRNPLVFVPPDHGHWRFKTKVLASKASNWHLHHKEFPKLVYAKLILLVAKNCTWEPLAYRPKHASLSLAGSGKV